MVARTKNGKSTGKAEVGDRNMRNQPGEVKPTDGRPEAGPRVGSDFPFAAVARLSGKARKTSLMQAGDAGNSSHHQAGKKLHRNHVPVVKSTRG
jgi:hypothetical protein